MALKSTPLLLKSIVLIPQEEIVQGSDNQTLIIQSEEFLETYFTPGTAQVNSTQKNSSSGIYWEHELTFSFPGMITQEDYEKLVTSGAVVVKSEDARSLVFYRNDFFSNTKLKPDIVSAQNKSAVKFTITTLECL